MPTDSPQPAAPPLLVLLGPAGCGKTTVGALLARALAVPFVDGDDLHDPASVARMRQGLPLEDSQRAPWLDRVRAAMVAAHDRGAGLIVACSALKQAYRDRLALGLPARFVQLEVPADALRARLQARRGHFFPASLLDSQLAALEPLAPPDRVDATMTPEQIVAQICRSIG